MRTKTKTEAFQAQQRYRTKFDKYVKRVPAFARDEFAYLDKHALATSMKADDTTRKLQKEKVDPHKIVNVQPKTVTHEKGGILDTVSADRT